MATHATTVEPSSGWAPLRRPLFRNRWIAALVSNLGTWMQDTAGTWLMVSLTSSPLLIALMQTAASLPVLLLGVPAGATADMFDRRRLLIFWQSWMLVSVVILSVLTVAGVVSPWTLLVLTLLLNVGAAMSNPAWQAIVPELVPREELPDAIALNSAGFNLARAVGPALGGLVVAAFVSAVTGAGVVFFLNAISFVAVILVMYAWKRTPLFQSALPGERLFGAMQSAVQYVRHSPPLRAILLRSIVFSTFVSAMWALLAVVSQQDLQQGAAGYGLLNACVGLGAVAGATSLARLRRRFSADAIAMVATTVIAATLLIMAFSRSVPLILVALFAAGFSWTCTTSTLNVAVQLSVPAWVQARALGTYQMIFQGGMALGSALWGTVAEHTTASQALTAAALGLLATLPLALRYHLLRGAPPDLRPSLSGRPEPVFRRKPDNEEGPVLVTIEYRIPQKDYDAFTEEIHRLRDVRLRDGAIRWGVYQDAADPERIIETFVVDSWLKHLRLRERMTASDRVIRDRVRAFHQGPGHPVASHMIYARQRRQ
ncbi:MAG: MFS transporter [Bryobacteraceae bacterium]